VEGLEFTYHTDLPTNAITKENK
jgi:hypothetical protein